MNKFICIVIVSVILSITTHCENLFAGNEIDLGSHNTTIAYGILQDRYLPLTVVDELASKNARTLVELLKPIFSTGIAPLPRLEPYRSKSAGSIVLDSNDWPLMAGKINMNDLIVSGAKAFRLNLIEIRMKNFRIDFGFMIPVLHAGVIIRGNLRLGGFLPINIQGKIKVVLTGVSVNGAVQLKEKELPRKDFYNLQALHANVNVDNIKIELLDTNLNQAVLQRLSSSNSFEQIPNLDLIKDKVKNYVAKEILKQGNRILRRLTVDQVKAYLLSEFPLQ